MVSRFEPRLAGGKRNLLFKSRRLTLIKSSMANIPIYFMYLNTIKISEAKRLNRFNASFYEGDSDEKRRFHLVP